MPKTISDWNYVPDSVVYSERNEDFEAALTNFLQVVQSLISTGRAEFFMLSDCSLSI